MANKARQFSFSKEDLLCPLCSEVFSQPVQLQCGHNYCKTCLHDLWERRGLRECPLCRTRSFSVRPPVNLALKIAADTFAEQSATRDVDTEEELCHLHAEKLNLFCQNDEEPICLICQASKQHKTHDCCTTEEAAMEKKMEFFSKIDSLRKHLKKLNKTKEDWEETKRFIKSQADQTEQQVRAEFESLHRFLWEEEKRRVAALRQEQETKTQVMGDKLGLMEGMITALTHTISEVEVAIRANDVTFLQAYKEMKRRTTGVVREPECIRGILIDAARHLGSLKWTLWRKMADMVQWVPITLDPNTAQPNLSFSEEFSRVQYDRKMVLPDNPERFTSRMSVLGATGFNSGKHSWTVEVGQGKDWYIGVARESVKRKTTVFLNPGEGFWCIGLCNGETYWAQTSPRTRLPVRKERRPWRVTVELDYDRGKVSFLNAADSAIIHVFREKFTERIFPYFSPGLCADGNTSSQLAICPMTIAVEVLDHVKIP
ncbi:zinc-binding protein A33-like [Esox lucius]|uniref:Zinc-binding protein A33-like n=1 Tax=Esox lucius TaxID=8010 RepID=A0A6Q2Y2U1_ESOLU|nr:zinc-binding protein A33-like [Esox lucius]